MEIFSAFAQTFQVTEFDILFFLVIFFMTLIMYYFWTLHTLYEIAFGAIVGIGIYVLLSVLLLGNGPMGTSGGLFPFPFAVVIISIAVYSVFILAVLFPLHGGLVISETTNPTVYTAQYIFVSMFLLFSLTAVIFYMIEQTYIFQVGTIFAWFRDASFYENTIRPSAVFGYMMAHKDVIVPLGVLLMLYKLLLANILNAVALSIWYNLAHIGFYRKNEDAAYRVEFHEVGGGHGGGHDAHDTHAADSHDKHGGHH
ncbi:hypothetical protein K2X92_02520 [Candidatus Gracilibacteria bacterium]|nr:hypothetical protein [Candidatus Gracilibacteria bacterium]